MIKGEPDSRSLPDWMEEQYRFSARAMLRAVSAVNLIKERPELGQRIRPARGSVLAAPQLASYDPDPDYFFHWLRDSALVMDAVRELVADGAVADQTLCYFDDFIGFSLQLCRLDGGKPSDAKLPPRAAESPFARARSDLIEVAGDRALAEARYNPDGTLDILEWARPQNDGPALRAILIMRLLSGGMLRDASIRGRARALLDLDLAFTFDHFHEPCFDIWEESSGSHYYTRIVQYAALTDGSAWMGAVGNSSRARAYEDAARALLRRLDAHWNADKCVYVSSFVKKQGADQVARGLDAAVLLGLIHAARAGGPHSVVDPKAFATLIALERLFSKNYVINRQRPNCCAPAMGRYANDSYYSGGAYYFCTLAAAQFYYSFAEAIGAGADIPVSDANHALLSELLNDPTTACHAPSLEPWRRERLFHACVARGDMFMSTVRIHTPATGEFSEQFDQQSGAQTSAKNLAWSYASFITAFAKRKAALLQCSGDATCARQSQNRRPYRRTAPHSLCHVAAARQSRALPHFV